MDRKILKILAIDDNRDNLISLKALIEESFPSATFFSAIDGRKGFKMAVSEDPDVILLDILMPGMDGFEVCKKLKANKKCRDIPVIFITALKADKENRIRALKCGAESFLSKPIDQSELTAQIRAMAKIKAANLDKRDEKERLKSLIAERTSDLEKQLAENKRTEKKLKESNELFSLFLKHSPVYAYIKEVTSTESRVLRASENYIDMIGIKGSQMAGKTMEELFPVEFAAKITADDREVVSLGKVLKLDEDLNDRNYTTVKFPISKGSKSLLAGYTIDITERKQAEQKLKQSEMLYRSITENSPDLIARFDKKFRHLFVNPAAAKAGPHTPEAYIDKSMAEVGVPESEARKWESRIKSVFSSGKILDVQDSFKTTEGMKYFNTKFVPELAPDGSVRSVQSIARDITEFKLAEEELNAKVRELERFNKLMVGRELKMVELKTEINELLEKAGKKAKYKIHSP